MPQARACRSTSTWRAGRVDGEVVGGKLVAGDDAFGLGAAGAGSTRRSLPGARPSPQPPSTDNSSPSRHALIRRCSIDSLPAGPRPNPHSRRSTCLGDTIQESAVPSLPRWPGSSSSQCAHRRPSSRPRAACTRLNTRSRPSRMPAQLLVSSHRTASCWPPSARSPASCWSRTPPPRSCTSSMSASASHPCHLSSNNLTEPRTAT